MNTRDYRQLARRRVPPFLFEYLDGASFTESTKAANERDLAALELRQQVLKDVSALDTSTTLLGSELAMPLALGPIGLAGIYARRGEVQALLAAESAGVPFTLSTVGVCPIGEVDEAARKPFWFQLYLIRDRGFMKDLLSQARAAKISALFLTVDMPVPGIRYRDYRSGLAGESWISGNVRRLAQALLKPGWALDVGLLGRPLNLGNVAPTLGKRSGLEDFMYWMTQNFDPAVSWNSLDFVREHWEGPIILKGILDVEDARQAVSANVDGIVVSNHGGRQLDGVRSTARALPAIVDAVGDQTMVLADGGIYSGLDVLRLLALGADGVMLGRSWVYALAADGQSGVRHVLELIQRELQVAMALTGCRSIADIDQSCLTDRAPC